MTRVSEEGPVDRLDALVLEVRAGFAEVRADFAEVRAGHAELRAGLAEVRAELAGSKVQHGERHLTLIDAIADLRNEYRGHTHDG